MKDIAIYGAGGYGCEVFCLLQAINRKHPQWNFIGFFDDVKEKGAKNKYGRVLGGMEALNDYPDELSIVMAIGSSEALKVLTSAITNPRIEFPNIIAPDVTFHDRESVQWGRGNVVFFHSLISYDVSFGDFNLLNNDVFVGHESLIGSYNVINPSVRISGNVELGDTNFLGVGAIVLQKLKIGSYTKVAANSCVMRNTKDRGVYIGSPAVLRVTPDMK